MVSREEQRREAERIAKQRVECRDDGGYNGKRVIDLDKIGGYKKDLFYKPREGINKIDVLPYMIKSDNHPQGMGKGYTDFILDIWVHRFVGPSRSTYLCLSRYNGKACPICEEHDERKTNPNEKKEVLDALRAKQRCFYNVIDVTLPERDQKVQLFEEAYFLFEKEILNKIATKLSLKDHGVQTYYEIENGKTLVFSAERKQTPKGKSWIYRIEDFADRIPYNETIFKETYSLDEMLIVPTYDEVRAAHYGSAESHDDGDDFDPAPVHTPRTREKVVVPEEYEEPVTRRRPATPEAEAQRRRSRPEPEPVQSSGECPFGHVFGADNTNFVKEGHCNSCEKDIWDACSELHDKLAEEVSPARRRG